MISRCKPVGGHKRYGGRGIRVCERWLKSFEDFLADMGLCPGSGFSIHRIDNDGDYCPENCCWATSEEQGNNKCNNIFLEHDGRRLTISRWARVKKLSRQLIHLRLSRGWDVAMTLDTPPRERPRPTGRRASTSERVEQAKALRQEGKSHREIADAMGVSMHTVYNWIGAEGSRRGRPCKGQTFIFGEGI